MKKFTLRAVVVALLTVLPAVPALALEFDLTDGISLKMENLFTVGGLIRAQERDPTLVAKSNLDPEICVGRSNPTLGPKGSNTFFQDTCTTSRTVRGDTDNSEDFGVGANDQSPNAIYVRAPGSYNINGDNGNLNFEKGELVYATSKMTTDWSSTVSDFNIFVRTVYFFDPVYLDKEEYHPDTTLQSSSSRYSGGVQSRVGTDFDVLDYFVSRTFTVADHDFSVKLGNQVLNWGESAFLALNSLNTINAPDSTRLRVPGFDVKELFQPQGMLLVGTELVENVNLEVFYQYEWKPAVVDPVGSFFSVSDVLGDGGQYAMLSFGKAPEDPGNLYEARTNPDDPLRILGSTNGRTIFRDYAEEERRRPDDGGQYGFSVKTFLPDFNNGTEVGFYYANYHARIPSASLISSQSGCVPNPAPINTPAANLALLAVSCGLTPSTTPGVLAADPDNPALPVDTARIFVEYPENIQMFGTSFNTTIGDWAWSGELVYRPNLPIQIHTVDLTLAAVGPAFPNQDFNIGASVLPSNRTGAPDFVSVYRGIRRPGTGGGFGYGPGQYVQGYEREQIYQLGNTFLKTIGGDNPFEASQITLLLESGATFLPDMPDITELQFQGAETNAHISNGADGSAGINPRDLTAAQTDPDNGLGCAGTMNVLTSAAQSNQRCLKQNPTAQDPNNFPSAFSWGYRAIMLTRYDSALFGANLENLFGFFHDFEGITPGLGQNFVEGRKNILWGVRFDYLSKWIGEVRYTWFTGGGNRDSLRDRDNAFVFVGYQF